MKGCGRKFEFMEADNIYVANCCEEELCPDCLDITSNAKESQ